MEIKNYRPQAADAKYTALFDIVTDWEGIEFRNWKLIKGKNGWFIGCPSYVVEQFDGKKDFIPYVELPKEIKKSFQDKVLAMLKTHCLEM